MGNWRNRPRFYRKRVHRSPPRSWYCGPYSSSSGFGKDDGIPAWEKKFCELIGSVPWQKVVEFNNLKSCYQGKVTSWNASACEEAFRIAKRRFWSEMNGLPCDISPPDPNMYIDEIDWDTVIDPELINDLEREYHAVPVEGRIDSKSGHQNKKTGDSKAVPFEESNEETDVSKNPWEGSDKVHGGDMLRNELQGWNLWENYSNNKFKDSDNYENPWKGKPSRGNETAKDAAWGACLGKGWEDNEWENERWGQNNRWKNRDRGNNGREKEGWGNKGWYKLGHQNKKTRNSETVPSEECNQEFEMFKNPWDGRDEVCCSDMPGNKSLGLNLWESNTNNKFKDSDNCENSWQAKKPAQRNETAKDATWGDCSGKGLEEKGWGKEGWSKNRWDKYGDNSLGSKWRDSSKPNNGYNSWRSGFMPDKGAPREEAWGDCGAEAGDWQTQRTNNVKHRKWGVKRSSEGWGDPNAGSLKREGIHGYHSSYSSSRLKRDDNRTGSDWRNTKVSRRVTFAAK